MRRLTLAASMFLAAASTLGCSEDSGGDGGDETGGSGGASGSSTGGSSGASGSSMGGSSTGGSSTGGSSTGGSSTGGSSTGGASGSGGSAGGGGFMYKSLCDQHGVATVNTTTYMGTEEFYILSNEAYEDFRIDDPVPEDMVCRITFDVNFVGAAPAGCMDLDLAPCEWTHQIEYSNPQKLIDIEGACAQSEIRWDQAWIDQTNGSRVSYGYIDMYAGHPSVVMRYSEMSMTWVELTRAFWDSTTGELEYTNREECRY